jgi:VCBS repeat-containing protein
VTPAQGLATTEAGGAAAFTVSLSDPPSSTVIIDLSSSDPTEGTVLPASLVFTSANWFIAQEVFVTGVDDPVDDGDIPYTIITAAAASADPAYQGVNALDVSVTNTDNDTAGIQSSPSSGLVTSETGDSASYSVSLSSQPTASVSFQLGSRDTTEGTASPGNLTFTPENWSAPQVVTVTGVDDPVDDGDIAYRITYSRATSADPAYNGLRPAHVSLTNLDNDEPVAASDDSYRTGEDQPLHVAAPGVLGNDSSVGNTVLSTLLISDVAHGNLLLYADGAFDYTPNPNYTGEDTFTYQATSSSTTSNTAQVTIIIDSVNDPPAAIPDTFTTEEDSPLNTSLLTGVLKNDTDVENDPLTASLISSVAHGSLTFRPDGSFTYAPQANFNGQDSFTYTVSDGLLGSNTTTVTLIVNPVNDAPVASPENFLTRTLYHIGPPGLLSNDVDIDPGETLSAVLVKPPEHGVLTLNANGSFDYQPNPQFNGVDRFMYAAWDGEASSNAVEVQITVDILPPNPARWIAPVRDGEISYVGDETVLLEVATDPKDTDLYMVRFTRWDPIKKNYIEIGNVYQPPFRATIDTKGLVLAWNQVFALVYDQAGNISERRFVWLYLENLVSLFLPVVAH